MTLHRINWAKGNMFASQEDTLAQNYDLPTNFNVIAGYILELKAHLKIYINVNIFNRSLAQKGNN